MPNPVPLPTAPARTQTQRIGDLTRERDRIASNLVETKRLFGFIRETLFRPEWDANQIISALRQTLVDNWEATTPPGKMFDLVRCHDSSKVSGEGRVAEGVEFENGKVALCWLGQYASVNVYDSVDHVKHIHGHGGSTEVVYR